VAAPPASRQAAKSLDLKTRKTNKDNIYCIDKENIVFIVFIVFKTWRGAVRAGLGIFI
jgi:hypothetical protein